MGANFTIPASDTRLIFTVDNTTATAITLPPANVLGKLIQITPKIPGGNQITINPSTGDTINIAPNLSLTSETNVTRPVLFFSDGNRHWISTL